MFLKCAVFFAIAALATARTTASSENNAIPEETARSTDDSFFGDLKFLHKMYTDCSATDLSTCLKLKLVTAMDRASRSYPSFQIVEGVSFVKDETTEQANPQSENEIEAALPRAVGDREDALNTMIFDKIANFFQTHSLQVKFPTSVGEERGRKKKMHGLLLLPLLLGGALVPLALGALALLAGKALIVSKLALVLASIIGLKKLFSHHGHHGHEEVVVTSGHGGSGWGRSYEKQQQQQAQNLAYNAYAPKSS